MSSFIILHHAHKNKKQLQICQKILRLWYTTCSAYDKMVKMNSLEYKNLSIPEINMKTTPDYERRN